MTNTASNVKIECLIFIDKTKKVNLNINSKQYYICFFNLITILSSIINNWKTLARQISLVENNHQDGLDILKNIKVIKSIPIIGITGPPGAGKSSLVNALISKLVMSQKNIGIIAVDPTSPFNFGSLLGDRVRMAEHFNNNQVYIRSIASRGSLGGLSNKITEIVDVMKQFPFDYIFIETVGVGQSEVEIAGLADTTIVTLVPEAGDEIQTLKSGLMEIADIFVINKSDREGADVFVKNLSALVHQHQKSNWEIPVLKTVATNNTGVDELIQAINKHHHLNTNNERKLHLLSEKAWSLLLNKIQKTIDKEKFLQQLKNEQNKTDFNLYQFVEQYIQ